MPWRDSNYLQAIYTDLLVTSMRSLVSSESLDVARKMYICFFGSENLVDLVMRKPEYSYLY